MRSIPLLLFFFIPFYSVYVQVSGTLNDEMKGTPRLSRIYQRDKLGRVDLLKDYNFILLETDNPKGYLVRSVIIDCTHSLLTQRMM